MAEQEARVERLNIPDLPAWRPGALYWRPLDDGNEITVYPTVTGGAQICLGPLADPYGYDASWQYAHVEECLTAAREWDGESDPPGKWLRASGADEHGKQVVRRHGQPKTNENFKIEEGDRVETVQVWGQAFPARYLIQRSLPDASKTLNVEAVHDPQSPNGVVKVVSTQITDSWQEVQHMLESVERAQQQESGDATHHHRGRQEAGRGEAGGSSGRSEGR